MKIKITNEEREKYYDALEKEDPRKNKTQDLNVSMASKFLRQKFNLSQQKAKYIADLWMDCALVSEPELIEEELLSQSSYSRVTYKWKDKNIVVDVTSEYDNMGCYQNEDREINEDYSDELTKKEKEEFENFLMKLK